MPVAARPKDGIEAHRLEAPRPWSLRRPVRDDGERDTPAVDRQLQLAGERRGIAGPPYGCPFLEGRDLRQVECVAHEDAVTREIDGREVIDGEVAERMGRGNSGCEQTQPPRR